MKQQIRKGVFETNSSSTHSIQLVDCDKASDIAYETMIENLKNSLSDGEYSTYNIENCDTLILKGFYETMGDENHFVSHEIYTPLAKIQYIFSYLYMYLGDNYSFIKTDLTDDELAIYGKDYYQTRNGYVYKGKRYTKNENFSLTTECFETHKEYKWFKSLVLNYVNNSMDFDFEIKKLEVANEVSTPSFYSEFGDKELNFDGIFKNEKTFTEFFNTVMDRNKTILLMDVPYSPYGSKPEMYKH